MKLLLRVLSGLVGLILLVSGLRWILDPAGAAAGLGMPLLEGTAASTQIGDIGAFFVAAVIMLGLAQRRGETHWFYPPALLLACAALMRTLAAVTGHAEFAFRFVAIEVIMAGILLAAARARAGESPGT